MSIRRALGIVAISAVLGVAIDVVIVWAAVEFGDGRLIHLDDY